MSDSPIPEQQKQITFYDDSISAVQLATGDIYVPIRQMCDLLGVSYQGQIDRIRRDPVLSKYELMVPVEGMQGGSQTTNCIALKYIPGWLFGINASRVKPKVQAKLVLYQEQVYDVIWEAFRAEIEPPTITPPNHPEPLDDLSAIEQMGLAIYRLARQQRAMEARISGMEDALWEVDERTRSELDLLKNQLTTLELRLSPPKRPKAISEKEAAELSQAVKTVAMALGKKTKRNEFGAVYGELYRRFGITSYRNLPVTAFQEAMSWLDEWFKSIEGDGGTSEV